MSQSVTTLNSLMKYVLPEKHVSLIPDNVKFLKMLPELREAQKLGRKYLLPVELSAEGGVTYGDGSAFAYETVVDGGWGEAQLDAYPVVLNMELSRSAVDRLSNDKNSFVDVMGLKTKSMYTELARRAETSLFYGKSSKGLGTVGAITGTSGTSLVLTFSTGQWAPGIWAGRKNHRFEVRQTATGTARAGHSTNFLTLTTIDFVNKKCTFTGDATEIATVVATDVVYFRGAYTNDMQGLDAILTTSGTIFNIDNSANSLWKGSAYTMGSIAFSELIKAVGSAVAIGGLGEETVCFVNSDKYELLNSTVTNSNYRNTGASANDDAIAGVEEMSFQTQAGKCKLIGSPYVKEGDGFIFSLKHIHAVGAKMISFENSQGKGDYWLELPSNYGARMQGAFEFAILHEKPACAVKLTVPAS